MVDGAISVMAAAHDAPLYAKYVRLRSSSCSTVQYIQYYNTCTVSVARKEGGPHKQPQRSTEDLGLQ